MTWHNSGNDRSWSSNWSNWRLLFENPCRSSDLLADFGLQFTPGCWLLCYRCFLSIFHQITSFQGNSPHQQSSFQLWYGTNFCLAAESQQTTWSTRIHQDFSLQGCCFANLKGTSLCLFDFFCVLASLIFACNAAKKLAFLWRTLATWMHPDSFLALLLSRYTFYPFQSDVQAWNSWIFFLFFPRQLQQGYCV
jgi:hypothetical protein